MGFHIYFVIYGILQVKADGTCRYYPQCKYGDACNYRHPTAAEVSIPHHQELFAVLRIWIHAICRDPDPELVFRIQQKMTEQINKYFIFNFRPVNSGLCVL